MIEKDISQYLSLEQRARNLFGENYDLENCVEELRQYRRLTDRVKAIYGDQMTLKIMVDVMERIIREPGRKDPVNARILTCDEAAMWDEYRKIGTPEECRETVEKQIAKRPTLCKSDEQTTRYTADYRCPKCNGMFTGTGIANYCYHCGQRLDWEE